MQPVIKGMMTESDPKASRKKKFDKLNLRAKMGPDYKSLLLKILQRIGLRKLQADYQKCLPKNNKSCIIKASYFIKLSLSHRIGRLTQLIIFILHSRIFDNFTKSSVFEMLGHVSTYSTLSKLNFSRFCSILNISRKI